MIELVQKSFRLTSDNRRLLLFMYATNLIFGGIIAVVFYRIFLQEANGSIVLDKLVTDFDYMVFSDFWRIHSGAFMPVFLATFALGGLYFLVNTFFAGGVFYQFNSGSSALGFKQFLRASLKTFGKYLLLSLIVFLLGVFVFAFSGVLTFMFVKIAEDGSEREYILWMIPPAVFLIFLLGVLAVIRDYTRYILFDNEGVNFVSGFQSGISYVFRNFRTVGFYWLITSISVLVGLLYLLLDAVIGMRGEFTIALMIIIQQIIVLGRVFLKNWNFAFVSEFYQKYPIIFPQPVVEILTKEELADNSEENKPSDEA